MIVFPDRPCHSCGGHASVWNDDPNGPEFLGACPDCFGTGTVQLERNEMSHGRRPMPPEIARHPLEVRGAEAGYEDRGT